MARRKQGELWFHMPLFGNTWDVRLVATKSKLLEHGKIAGWCLPEDRVIYIDRGLSTEQKYVTLVHEIQHAIEDHAGVEHMSPAPQDVADRWTDQIALGWLYVIRHSPDLIKLLQGAQ